MKQTKHFSRTPAVKWHIGKRVLTVLYVLSMFRKQNSMKKNECVVYEFLGLKNTHLSLKNLLHTSLYFAPL